MHRIAPRAPHPSALGAWQACSFRNWEELAVSIGSGNGRIAVIAGKAAQAGINSSAPPPFVEAGKTCLDVTVRGPGKKALQRGRRGFK